MAKPASGCFLAILQLPGKKEEEKGLKNEDGTLKK